ncbi:hypothetical protein SNE40_009362 [Patella caerulea]
MENKIESIKQAKPPKTKKQLQSFLGLVGYYRQFVPNFSAVAVPLTDLTRKGQPNKLEWGNAQNNAFISLKQVLSNSPVLRLPDFTKTFILRTDASGTGLGAILLQEFEDGKFPLAYASKKLLPRETRYAIIEKECLALVWGIKRFEEYLYGVEFLVETDHEPLQYLHKAKIANNRIMRWALSIQNFSFIVRAIKGRDNIGADYLSRSFS